MNRHMPRWFGVALAFAAVSLVLAASAAARHELRPALQSPRDFKADTSAAVVRPDDRATHGLNAVTTITPVVAHSSSAGGFDWADAGIGAATVVGLWLFGTGALLVVRRQRSAALS
jgi:hypothetical protein